MRLHTICEALHTFPDGEPFHSLAPVVSDPETPVLPLGAVERLTVAYHASSSPDLAKVGILVRRDLGLPDLFASGQDSTHQDAVYLGVSPDIIRQMAVSQEEAPYMYEVDLRYLDKNRFRMDEDAYGWCVINDDWRSSVMCMGTFRYEGNIPAELVRLIQ